MLSIAKIGTTVSMEEMEEKGAEHKEAAAALDRTAAACGRFSLGPTY
jgi:hypothetical protein